MVKEQLLTVKETSERLGISVPRIHQLIQASELVAEKYGNQYLIKERDADALTVHGKAGRPPKEKAGGK